MKKFISGVVTGVILASTIAFAASYVAEQANFKILVNGEEFNCDPPAVTIDGRAYLPLRAMGDVLGVPVNWNEELFQAEVGSSPIAAGVENHYSRTSPAPIDTIQTYTDDDKYSTLKYSANIRVVETIRGEGAWNKIKEANFLNSEPKDGYEYILAKIAFSVISVQDDKAFTLSEYGFKAFSSNNEEMPKESVVEPNPRLEGKLYAGGNAEGWIAVLVKKDDVAPKMAYGLDYNGAGGVWFALYE